GDEDDREGDGRGGGTEERDHGGRGASAEALDAARVEGVGHGSSWFSRIGWGRRGSGRGRRPRGGLCRHRTRRKGVAIGAECYAMDGFIMSVNDAQGLARHGTRAAGAAAIATASGSGASC